jgi:hypothetical protein
MCVSNDSGQRSCSYESGLRGTTESEVVARGWCLRGGPGMLRPMSNRVVKQGRSRDINLTKSCAGAVRSRRRVERPGLVILGPYSEFLVVRWLSRFPSMGWARS